MCKYLEKIVAYYGGSVSLHEKETKEQYAIIGEFAVKFEHVCEAVRSGIVWLLHENGLTNQAISNILLARRGAINLKEDFRSLIEETQTLTDKDKGTSKNPRINLHEHKI